MRWIAEDGIWIATSNDVPGLVIEGATWTDMMREANLVLPELLASDGRSDVGIITFRAEEQAELVA